MSARFPKLLQHGVIDWFLPAKNQRVSEWVEENVDLTDDTTSPWNGLVDLNETPHLIEPLDAWGEGEVDKITCMGPEQTNKSCTWQWGLLNRMCVDPGSTLVVWRNIDESKDMFSDRMLPIMRRIPKLRRALDRPSSCKKDRYDLGDMILYNQGAGSPILSKPARYRIGDELDFWKLSGRANSKTKGGNDKANVSNLANLDKRGRAYGSTGKRAIACSPTTKAGETAREYNQGSRGRWNLACANCDGLTPSHWFSALKFEKDETGEIIADSIRWHCRHCGHKHKEADKRLLNRRGVACYVHERPERTAHKSFQWSSLAAHWIAWKDVCRAISKGGKNGTREDQLFLDNSHKGIPWEPRVQAAEEREALLERCREVPEESIICVVMSVDTQDLGYWWIVRGIDDRGNTHRIAHGYLHTEDELKDLYNNRQFAGRLCRYMIIDRGGHRTPDIDKLVCELPNAYCYHGRGANTQALLAWSNQVHRCLLGNANIFAQRLLFRLWMHQNEASGYWYLGDAATMTEDYKTHLLSWGPPAGKPKADISEWELLHDRNHLFDCEKMWMMITEEFREVILAEWEREKEAREKGEDETATAPAGNSGGFVGGGNFITGWQ